MSRDMLFCRAPPHFWLYTDTVQLVVMESAFVMVSTVWSVCCLLFFYLRCSACPAICKVGARAPHVPYGVGDTEGVYDFGLGDNFPPTYAVWW